MTNTTDTTLPTTSDPRPAFAAAVDVASGVIAAVRTDHLVLSTPCDAMTVGDLLSHLMMVADRVACAARGDDLATWAMEGPVLEIDEWAPAWRTAAAAAVTEWAAMAAHMPEGIAWESPFTNAVPVSDNATAVERLVAWNGRDPG